MFISQDHGGHQQVADAAGSACRCRAPSHQICPVSVDILTALHLSPFPYKLNRGQSVAACQTVIKNVRQVPGAVRDGFGEPVVGLSRWNDAGAIENGSMTYSRSSFHGFLEISEFGWQVKSCSTGERIQ